MDDKMREHLKKAEQSQRQARKEGKFSAAGYFLQLVGGPLDSAPWKVCVLSPEYYLPYNKKAIDKAGERLSPGENGWTHDVPSFDHADGVALYRREGQTKRYCFVEAMTVEEYRKRGGKS